jgi:hypothetical protein
MASRPDVVGRNLTTRERVEFAVWLIDKAVLVILAVAVATAAIGGAAAVAWNFPRESAVFFVVLASSLLSGVMAGKRYNGLAILFALVAIGGLGYAMLRAAGRL